METNQKSRKVQELETALLELNTVRKNATVYRQQQNSNIFFLSDVTSLKAEIQKELNDVEKANKNKENS